MVTRQLLARHREAVSLIQRYEAIRARTLALVEPLAPEDCVVQSMDDVSPTSWHLAHTSWFFETFVLAAARPDEPPFDPAFAHLFNSYYNTVGEPYPRPRRGLLTRPRLDEILAYRAHVDQRIAALLAEEELAEEVAAVIELGLHHEQQHQELILTDIKHVLSCNPSSPAYLEAVPAAATAAPELAWIRFGEGLIEIGHAGNGFAFDNETPRHRVWVDSFEIASRQVTNGEFRAFIDDGGYQRPELWLDDGWQTVAREGWTAPIYWRRTERGLQEFTLHGERPLDDAQPVVHLSYYEGDAFARWAGARLPTEAEWEIAAAAAKRPGALAEDATLHPRAAARAEPGAPVQMFGDAWEWTSSPYSPYPGFRPLAGSLGEYNGKFMCGQLVLRGGSCVTPRGHVRPTYRNFFPPAARWQLSGIRLAR